MPHGRKRATVMGLGRFGGGSGVARWLVSQGYHVTVTDMKPTEELVEPTAELDDLVRAGHASLHLGGHIPQDFTDTDLVIANPAVPHPWDNPLLLLAQHAGVAINTEIGLFTERLTEMFGIARTIGITGTVGKSTTTAMIAHALTHTGLDVALGGNIGGSLLERLEPANPHAINARTVVVLELSSFMLYWLGRVQRFSPRIAVVTNIGDNHLDWHETMDHYAASKQAILLHQHTQMGGKPSAAILGRSVSHWAEFGSRAPGRTVLTEDRPLCGTLGVPGLHNRINAEQALRACAAFDETLRADELASAIRGFPGLDHRLQLVRDVRGVKYYNDSKCTTPEACLTAIAALGDEGIGPQRIHLIAGGYDKHADLSAIGKLGPKLAGLYCIGATGPAIVESALAATAAAPSSDHSAHISMCETLERAIAEIAPRTRPGDVVLLSPACASWGQFTNYEFRGRRFIELVGKISS